MLVAKEVGPIMLNRFSSRRFAVAILFAALLPTGPAQGQDLRMTVVDNDYLSMQGFDAMLYDNTFHPVFVDEKNTALQMILHGERIATNGDVRLMPTPEQWDLVSTLSGRHADAGNGRLTADLPFPTYQMDDRLEVAAESGGIRVSVNLAKPLPEKLAGRAGFNLEFLPSIYLDKTYAVDGRILGTHPVSSTSYVSSVGTVSKLKAYGNNRSDNTFIPGGVIPGHIVIKPNFPECIDDFGFLWFEDEYVIDIAGRSVLAANAANALVQTSGHGAQ